MEQQRRQSGVEYERMGDDYLEKRQLQKGAAGWLLLAGLGVAYVISGDFAGWNFGLSTGGWGGLLIATVLMAVMYTCMVFGLAEMASALPVAGAGYGFARRALGPLGGFATGTAILIEYAIAPGAIAVFIGGYVEALGLFGLTSGWPVYLACYVIFIGIHLYGVGEALKVMFVITAIAVVALLAFVIGMLPHFDPGNLLDIAPPTRPGPTPSSRSGSPASSPRSSTASGSSSPSRASRWPPRRPATRRGTCPRASSPRCSCCSCSPPSSCSRHPAGPGPR